MNNFVIALKKMNWRLYSAVLAMMLLPSVWQTIRIYFLGDLPDANSISIASQLSWVSLLYEVVQEALILPLFCLLGKALSDKDSFANRVRTGLLITACIYLSLSVLIFIFARQLVMLMAQDTALIEDTVQYIRLETIAALFATLWRFMMIVCVTLKKEKRMYMLLAVQMVLSVIFDSFFVSRMPFSLQIGVNGIAVTNGVVNLVLVLAAVYMLKKDGVRIFCAKKLDFRWLKEWFAVGKFSGLESLLRNLAFSVMVIRMVNIVSEQGNYWIANNFIWQWLLLPALALADVVKKEVAEDVRNISRKTYSYIACAVVFVGLWLISIPLWKPFLQIGMNVQDIDSVFYIALLQTPFYITFIFNSCILDSTFYGVGKTNYMLIQSVCIDGFYYGVLFILYLNRIFVPSLTSISLMFGCGMLLDFIPTIILYRKFLRDNSISIYPAVH